MSALCSNVAQVKLDIKQILENLQQLSDFEGKERNFPQLKTETEELLNQLESLPLDKIKTKLKKRQRQRRNRKLQKRKLKEINKKLETSKTVPNIANQETASIAKPFNQQPKYNQLRVVKECQRFLQTFELLEQLHFARGQNSSETYKFSLKTRQLKSIWNCLLQDKLQEITSPEVIVQQQWNEVLFGPPEKTYFQNKPDLEDFIRKRYFEQSFNVKFNISF